MTKEYPGVPNEPVAIDSSDYSSFLEGFKELIERLKSVSQYYNVPFGEISGQTCSILWEVLHDNHPGFKIKMSHPLQIKKTGAPPKFTTVDLIMLMSEIGYLFETGELIPADKGFKNEADTFRLLAKRPYFLKRAKEWGLYKIYPKTEIDEEKLASRIHDIWRKDIRPILTHDLSKNKFELSNTQISFRTVVLPILCGNVRQIKDEQNLE